MELSPFNFILLVFVLLIRVLSIPYIAVALFPFKVISPLFNIYPFLAYIPSASLPDKLISLF